MATSVAKALILPQPDRRFRHPPSACRLPPAAIRLPARPRCRQDRRLEPSSRHSSPGATADAATKPAGRAAVRADVFGNSGYPQMLVRVGWAAVDAEPLPATPRRPLPEVANWLLDEAFDVGPDVVSRTG
jgi:hypothetical protein